MVKALVLYTRDPGFDSQTGTIFLLPLLFTNGEAVPIWLEMKVSALKATYIMSITKYSGNEIEKQK